MTRRHALADEFDLEEEEEEEIYIEDDPLIEAYLAEHCSPLDVTVFTLDGATEKWCRCYPEITLDGVHYVVMTRARHLVYEDEFEGTVDDYLVFEFEIEEDDRSHWIVDSLDLRLAIINQYLEEKTVTEFIRQGQRHEVGEA